MGGPWHGCATTTATSRPRPRAHAAERPARERDGGYELHEQRGCPEQAGHPRRGRLPVPRGRADLRRHGVAHGRSRWRLAGYALLGRAGCVTADRNDPDVRAHEGLPCGPLAEANLHPDKPPREAPTRWRPGP